MREVLDSGCLLVIGKRCQMDAADVLVVARVKEGTKPQRERAEDEGD